MDEKRGLARVKFDDPIYMRKENGEEIATTALNYSLRGVGVYCSAPPAVGEVLDLKFYVNCSDRPREVHMRGKVKHIHQYKDVFFTGLAFCHDA
jgi:hypothetical protein